MYSIRLGKVGVGYLVSAFPGLEEIPLVFCGKLSVFAEGATSCEKRVCGSLGHDEAEHGDHDWQDAEDGKCWQNTHAQWNECSYGKLFGLLFEI